MLDLYWRYVTQGAVDITSVISPPTTDLRARAQRLGGDPPDTEVVTHRGSEVTLRGSGDEEGHDAPRPEPPRAGRSRPPRPKPYIPSGTDPWSAWQLLTACQHASVQHGCCCGIISTSGTSVAQGRCAGVGAGT